MKFQEGDRVRIIQCGMSSNPQDSHNGGEGDIERIDDRGYFHVKTPKFTCYASKIELIERSEPMSQYSTIKQRIENLSGDSSLKELDDLLQEITRGKYYWLGIGTENSNRDCISIYDLRTHHSQPIKFVDFSYANQCEKLTALKSALLWLLQYSDIKKDAKQDKIAELKKELAKFTANIEKKIEELGK